MNETPTHTPESWLSRQLLIAMPDMGDPNFARSVTLLCQHNEDGAIGITINRTSSLTLGELFEQLDIPCDDEALAATPVLEGGPVSPDRGFVLHSPTEGFDSSLKVDDEIMVTTSRDVLAAIAAGKGPERFVVALGYAGWGGGQLEDELRENAWLAVAADSDIVFEQPLARRWELAVARLGIDAGRLHSAGGHA